MIGPLTYLDAALIAVCFISALLGHVPRAHARADVDPVMGGGGRRDARSSC